jgi:radical SAM superfamily enzyme YgiQ (UPF0313 family)
MSVGVQDFSPEVQVAVNRVQSLDETKLVIDSAREFGFKGISVDLIYGLPKQNVISFNHTLDEVIKLSIRTASRSTTTRTCRAWPSRSGASTKPTCPRPMRACRSCNSQSAA